MPGEVVSAFPPTLKKEVIDAKHPEFECAIDAWRDLEILVEGGWEVSKNAHRFIRQRPKEPADVYSFRCKEIRYTNILGQAFGWYRAAIFSESADVNISRGEKDIDSEAPGGDQFYFDFLNNCDRGGTGFISYFKRVFTDLGTYGRSFVMTELPKPPVSNPASKAQQLQTGALDPYLVRFDPKSVINWGNDQQGNLTRVVISQKVAVDGPTFPFTQIMVEQWLYIDQTGWAIYRQKTDDEDTVALFDNGIHAMAADNRLPIRMIELRDELYFGKRVFLPIRAHLNDENALAFSLLMSALAMLVIKGQTIDNQVVAEHAYFQLEPDGDISWLEPEGKSLHILKEVLRDTKEDVFRLMYLLAQARTTNATAAAQSGLSKEWDMMPAYEVVAEIVSIVRDAMIDVLNDVAVIRESQKTDLKFEVKGLGDAQEDVSGQLDIVERVRSLDVQSDTLDQETSIRASRFGLGDDADPETLDKIELEIRSAPTKSQRDKAQQDALAAAVGGGIGPRLGGPPKPKVAPKPAGR